MVLVMFVVKWDIYPDIVIKGRIIVPMIIKLIIKAMFLGHLKKSNYIGEERYQIKVNLKPYKIKERIIDGVIDVTFGLLVMEFTSLQNIEVKKNTQRLMVKENIKEDILQPTLECMSLKIVIKMVLEDLI